jgi:hypothetical protein
MNPFVASVLRELAQKGVGVVALWVVAHGLPVPSAVTDWAVLAIVGGGVAAWTTTVRFLETRNNKVAQLLARLLMLGIQAKPVYTKPVESA